MSEEQAEHQAIINARELPAAAARGEAEEMRSHRIRCTSCKRSTIARFYLAHDESTGAPAAWLWVPAYQTAGGMKAYAQATAVPLEAGQVAWTQIAQCARCRATWVAFPGGVPLEVEAMPNRGAGTHVAMSVPGHGHDREWSTGDQTMSGKMTAERIDGVGPCVLVRLESVTWGTVTE